MAEKSPLDAEKPSCLKKPSSEESPLPIVEENLSPRRKPTKDEFFYDTTEICLRTQKGPGNILFRGHPQKWRDFQAEIARILNLQQAKKYREVMCVRYVNKPVPFSLDSINEVMTVPHFRARFFFEDVLPKISFDPGRDKPRYCTAFEALYLKNLMQKAEKDIVDRPPDADFEWVRQVTKDITEVCACCIDTDDFVIIDVQKEL